MCKRARGWAGLIVCILAVTVVAQQPPLPTDAPTRDEVMQFMELMHAKDQMSQMQALMNQQVQMQMQDEFKKHDPAPTPEQQKQMMAAMQELLGSMPLDDMLEALIPIYQRHLNKSDMDASIAFYKSPAGQKILRELPAIMQESMESAMNIVRTKMEPAMKKMQERMAEILKTGESEKQ